MARHHVRPDGSVGRCDAKEGGRCKFAREGALHFESASEAQEYAAEVLARACSCWLVVWLLVLRVACRVVAERV